MDYILTDRFFQRSPLKWPRTSTKSWVTVPTVRRTTITRPFCEPVSLETQDPVPALLCRRVSTVCDSHHCVSMSTSSAESHCYHYSRNAKVLCMLLFDLNLSSTLHQNLCGYTPACEAQKLLDSLIHGVLHTAVHRPYVPK